MHPRHQGYPHHHHLQGVQGLTFDDVRQHGQRTSFGANVTFGFRRDDPAIDLGQRQRERIKHIAVGGCYAADRLEAAEKYLQHLALGCSNPCNSFRDDSDKSAALA